MLLRTLPMVAMSLTLATNTDASMLLPLSQLLQPLRRAAAGIVVAGTLALSPSASAAEVWNSVNGQVRLADRLVFPKQLRRPRLLGSGGGGAVFSFEESQVVVKVSWLGSAASVERECSILNILEQNGVQGVERCLAQQPYPEDARRVMIALEPLVDDAVANTMDVDASLRPHAIRCIMRTMVQMLAANVVTVDVQPLISKQTGDALFIDLTEAKVLVPPLSFLDVALMSSFCTEMSALIPESLLPVASTALLDELQALEQSGVDLSDQAYDVLRNQPFMSQETLDYIHSKTGKGIE
jgi:hypothetical protein